jgi:uncharacterized protein (TIGR02466 family)
MSSRIEMVFPSFICRGRLTAPVHRRLNRDLAEEIEKLEAIDPHGRRWSRDHYQGGYSSYSSFARLHETSPNFAELERRLAPHVARFIRGLNWDLGRRRLRMTTCWANVMGRGTHHGLHIHPLSVLSGVYYVNVPKNSSALKIEDPRMGLLMAAPPRRRKAPAHQQNYLWLQPKAGEFVLFESWMRHEVPPHRGREPRLSISFNYEL